MRQLPPKVKENAGIARLPGQKCAFAGKFRPFTVPFAGEA